MIVGCCIALFVATLVSWVAALATADRPDDRIESWDNGLATSDLTTEQ